MQLILFLQPISSPTSFVTCLAVYFNCSTSPLQCIAQCSSIFVFYYFIFQHQGPVQQLTRVPNIPFSNAMALQCFDTIVSNLFHNFISRTYLVAKLYKRVIGVKNILYFNTKNLSSCILKVLDLARYSRPCSEQGSAHEHVVHPNCGCKEFLTRILSNIFHPHSSCK